MHVISSEDDDFLTWPFCGNIEVTLKNIRHGGDGGKRDLVEIMQTSNFTEAFEKPKSGQRNLVGYGWKHFVPLNTIFENGFYGKSKNMIAIMADIKPLSEQRECWYERRVLCSNRRWKSSSFDLKMYDIIENKHVLIIYVCIWIWGLWQK